MISSTPLSKYEMASGSSDMTTALRNDANWDVIGVVVNVGPIDIPLGLREITILDGRGMTLFLELSDEVIKNMNDDLSKAETSHSLMVVSKLIQTNTLPPCYIESQKTSIIFIHNLEIRMLGALEGVRTSLDDISVRDRVKHAIHLKSKHETMTPERANLKKYAEALAHLDPSDIPDDFFETPSDTRNSTDIPHDFLQTPNAIRDSSDAPGTSTNPSYSRKRKATASLPPPGVDVINID